MERKAALRVKTADGKWVMVPALIAAGGGGELITDETLKMENGVLSVNTAGDVEQDNTLPVTSAAVFVEVGNINALLETI